MNSDQQLLLLTRSCFICIYLLVVEKSLTPLVDQHLEKVSRLTELSCKVRVKSPLMGAKIYAKWKEAGY